MKINNVLSLTLLFLCLLFLVGCYGTQEDSTTDYQIDSIFTGTIEEKLVKDKMLVIKQ